METSIALRDSVASEIADQLDKISAYIDAPLLTQVQKVSVIDFLISEFPNMEVAELSKAVKLILAEKLTPARDVAYITKQSVGWWGTILSAYVQYRRDERRRPKIANSEALMLEEYKDRERDLYEGLIEWVEEHGAFPEYGWDYHAARKYAKEQGILNVSKKDRAEVWAIAESYHNSNNSLFGRKKKLSKSHLDYAVMRIHVNRLNQKDE